MTVVSAVAAEEIANVLDAGVGGVPDDAPCARVVGRGPRSAGRRTRERERDRERAEVAAKSRRILSFFSNATSTRLDDAAVDDDSVDEGVATDSAGTGGGDGDGGARVTCAASAARPPCPYCGAADAMRLMASESTLTCVRCDAIQYVVIDNEKPVRRDVPKDSTAFSFKRLSHFNEWLSQIQGVDHYSVPDGVVAAVALELKKHCVLDAAAVRSSQVKTVLKKMRLSKYYEHVPYIMSRLRGAPEDRMPPELERKLRAMFQCIQIPFVAHSPATRKNFLSYGYVLYKFVQLLGEERYMRKVSLLKSRDKLRAQDAIWRDICRDLDWEFVPSI